jgi:hypothetical protein
MDHLSVLAPMTNPTRPNSLVVELTWKAKVWLKAMVVPGSVVA